MRVTVDGQIEIPREIRDRFGFLPHTEVEFVVEGGGVRLVKADRSVPSSGIVERLRGSADTTMTTDEILDLTRGGS